MNKLNSSFWKLLIKYYLLPVLLYLILLLYLAFNCRSCLSHKAFTTFLPEIMILGAGFWMWFEHNKVFTRWALELFGETIRGKYRRAFHVWTSFLLMGVLALSMYGVYSFVTANVMTVQHVENFDNQTLLTDDLRIVVDNLLPDTSVRVANFEISTKSDKYDIFTTNVYSPIEHRPDVWILLSDTIHMNNDVQRDSVILRFANDFIDTAMSYKPQYTQCYQIEVVEDDSLINDMHREYAKKYGVESVPQKAPVYLLSVLNITKMKSRARLGLVFLIPLFLLLLFVFYRLSTDAHK